MEWRAGAGVWLMPRPCCRKAVRSRSALADLLASLLAGHDGGGSRLGLVAQTFLQRLNAFADPFAKFGQLLGTEDEQGDGEDHQQVHGLEKAVKHRNLRGVRTG